MRSSSIRPSLCAVATVALASACVQGCSRAPTALAVAALVDSQTSKALDAVHVTVVRGGTVKFDETYSLTSDHPLPGTLVLQNGDDESPSDPVNVLITGTRGGQRHIDRRAIVGFIDEKTKLLKMPLTALCLDRAPCSDDQTCDEGTCVSATVDPSSLPDFTSNADAVASNGGAAGAGGSSGASGGGNGGAANGGGGATAGHSGSAGALGHSGAAGMGGAGMSGSSGMGGTSGSSGAGMAGVSGAGNAGKGGAGAGGVAGTGGGSGVAGAGGAGASGSAGVGGASGGAGVSGMGGAGAGGAAGATADVGGAAGTSSGGAGGASGQGGLAGEAGAGGVGGDTASGGGGAAGNGGMSGAGGSALVPGVFRVSTSAMGKGDGSSWSDAFTSVQPAVDAAGAYKLANAGMTSSVWVAEGTYAATAAATPVIKMAPGVDIYGGFLGNEASLATRAGNTDATILTGDFDKTGTPTKTDSCQVVYAATTARLDGFKVVAGYADVTVNTSCTTTNGAGAVVIGDSNVTFNNITFSGNRGTVGGALGMVAGSATVSSCRFLNNQGQKGGAIDMAANATPTPSNLTLINSLFYGNNNTDQAGALLVDHSTATITNCTFNANTDNGGQFFYTNGGACNGALLVVGGSTATVSNSVFFGNGVGGSDADICAAWNGTLATVSLTVNNTFFSKITYGTTKFTGTKNIIGTATPFKIVSTTVYLDPTADTNGAAAGTTNQAIDGGDDAAANDATFGYPAAGLDWTTMSTSSTGTKDATPVDMGVHY